MDRRCTPCAYASGVGSIPIQAAEGFPCKKKEKRGKMFTNKRRTRARSYRIPEVLPDIVLGPEVTIGGKQTLRQEVERDLVIEGKVIGTATYKTGEVKFPAAYWHDACEYAGTTVDARKSGDGKEWIILLHGVRTNDEGVPVVDENGQETEIVGWVLESSLTPMETEGMTQFIPGHSRNALAELKAQHTRKLVGFRAFHRTDDSQVFGPKRPRIEATQAPKEVDPEAHNWVAAERPAPADEIDDERVSETREMDEETYRFWNEFQDRPQELAAMLEGRDFVVEATTEELPPLSKEHLLRLLAPKRVRSRKRRS